ncbi:MAG TPA: SCO family protein [Longimicrobium sp.]|nr:SCO family protein [Longimicrobium sp.]
MRSPLRLPLIAAALVALAACGRGSAPVVPAADAPLAAASDFSVYDLEARWRDQDGRERVLGSLRGKTRVVAMVYTRCTHTCPAIVAEMKRLEAALDSAGRARVGFVLVSLDPERDDAAQLKTFATSMRLDSAAWTLLTADEDAVRELAALLGIRYRAEADAQISHSNTWLVLDADGRMVHRQDGVGSGTGAALARIRAAAAHGD